MIILTKKVFCFVNKEPNVSRDNARKFRTKGGMAVEEAPEWVQNDPLFQWAKADGDVIVVENNTAKAEAAAMAAATTEAAPAGVKGKAKK